MRVALLDAAVKVKELTEGEAAQAIGGGTIRLRMLEADRQVGANLARLLLGRHEGAADLHRRQQQELVNAGTHGPSAKIVFSSSSDGWQGLVRRNTISA